MVVFRIVCRFYHYKISFLVKCNPKEILIVVMILFNCLWKVRCLEFPLVRHYLLKVILSSHFQSMIFVENVFLDIWYNIILMCIEIIHFPQLQCYRGILYTKHIIFFNIFYWRNSYTRAYFSGFILFLNIYKINKSVLKIRIFLLFCLFEYFFDKDYWIR